MNFLRDKLTVKQSLSVRVTTRNDGRVNGRAFQPARPSTQAALVIHWGDTNVTAAFLPPKALLRAIRPPPSPLASVGLGRH